MKVPDIYCGLVLQVSNKATDALQFYEDHADSINSMVTSNLFNNFDWNKCRAYCSFTSRNVVCYSHYRFMKYVALWFDTTIEEMKTQWRNIKYTE